MILKKLIKLAFLLMSEKIAEKLIVDGKFNPDLAMGLLDQNLIEKICNAVCEDKPTNEVDALAGIGDFFLQLREQGSDSPNLLKAIKRLPIPQEMKIVFLQLIGKT